MTTPIIVLTSFIIGMFSAKILCFIRDARIKKKLAVYSQKSISDKLNISDLIGQHVCPPRKCEHPCPYNQACIVYHSIRTHDALVRVTTLIEDNIKKDLKL